MRLLIPAALAAALLIAAPAAAQEKPEPKLPGMCGQERATLDTLLGGWGETPFALAVSGSVPIIFTLNATTGTWSMLRVFPGRDLVCFMGSGQNWVAVEPSAPGEPL